MTQMKKTNSIKSWLGWAASTTLKHCCGDVKSYKHSGRLLVIFFLTQIPFLCMSPREMQARVYRETCTRLFIVALFIILQKLNQS